MAEDKTELNILGSPLEKCCSNPKTGFYRDGFCKTGPDDIGIHVVCAEVTQDFLEYSARQGNDLITPKPNYNFPGLKAGDRWCLCASRWKEAYEANAAPSIIAKATHLKAKEIIPVDILLTYKKD